MIDASISELDILYELNTKLLKKLWNSNTEEFSTGKYT